MKRIGVISVHTCPLAALGGKETGGMNVYVREVARHLGRLGLAVDVFTRKQTPGVPTIVPLGWGARVVHIDAGPQRPVPPPEIVTDLDEFTDGVMAFQRRSGAEYALLHGHYWLSGLVAVDLSRRFGGVPVVQMFHTLGVVKNSAGRSARRSGAAGARRRRGESGGARRSHRRRDAARTRRARVVLRAAVERVRTDSVRSQRRALQRRAARSPARERLRLDAEWVLLSWGGRLDQGTRGPPAGARAPEGRRARSRRREAGDRRRRPERGQRGSRAAARAGRGPRRRRVGRLQDPSRNRRCPSTTARPISARYRRITNRSAWRRSRPSACGATVVASRVGGLATTIQTASPACSSRRATTSRSPRRSGRCWPTGRGGALGRHAARWARACLADRGAGARRRL